MQLCRDCNNPMNALHCETIHDYRHYLCRWDNTRLFRGVWYSESEWEEFICPPEQLKKYRKDKKKKIWIK